MPRSHALLADLFDYAGLFPPASLPLDDALARYARYRGGPDGWMLGRFIVPAARLEACAVAPSAGVSDGGGDPWRLSVLAGPDPGSDMAQVSAFNGRHAEASGAAAVVDTVEMRIAGNTDVRTAREWAARGFDVYCEVAPGADMERLLDALAQAGLHAKLRMGGASADAIPAADDVAGFLCGCVARGVVAKATAGLHRAVTGAHPLTHAPEAARATTFGFLNLVFAAGIVEGAGRAAAHSPDVRATGARLLASTTPPVWVGRAALEWPTDDRPIIEGPIEPFAVGGRALIRSIGTCSFEEPVEHARRLDLLP